MTAYVIIGITILIFIFELLIIWYMYWIYGQIIDNFNDTEDMIVDIYNLEIAEITDISKNEDYVVSLPKRVRSRLEKRKH